MHRKLVEVWCFILQYRDVLNVPKDVTFPFDRITLFDEVSSADVTASTNVYQYLLQFLLAEEAKHAMTLRKQMLEVNWMTSELYGCNRFAGMCDASNFPSFIRGFFDRHSYDVADTVSPEQRMILVLLQLMRYPDGYIFLRPVDEEHNDVPGYKETIKNPMDFSTICRRLADGWYDEGQDCQDDDSTRGKGMVGIVRDIFLIYTNCRVYNGCDSSVYRYCMKMINLTETLLRYWVDKDRTAEA